MSNLCPTPGCNYPVTLRVCRGAKIPANKGWLYEVCLAPGDSAHLIRWKKDLGQQDILPFSPPQTLQQALQLPLTPRQVDPLSSPAVSRTSTPRSDYPPPPPAASQSFSSSEPAWLNTTVAHDLDNTFLTPPLPSQLFGNPDHTRPALNKKGKLISACNGPICRGPPPVHPGIRVASDCTHQFCKKCCQQFQQDGASECAMKTHSISLTRNPSLSQSTGPDLTLPAVADSTGIATATGVRLVTGSQDYIRPLRKEHYEARANAEIQQQIVVNRQTETKVAEAISKSTIDILYWKVRSSSKIHRLSTADNNYNIVYRSLINPVLPFKSHVRRFLISLSRHARLLLNEFLGSSLTQTRSLRPLTLNKEYDYCRILQSLVLSLRNSENY